MEKYSLLFPSNRADVARVALVVNLAIRQTASLVGQATGDSIEPRKGSLERARQISFRGNDDCIVYCNSITWDMHEHL